MLRTVFPSVILAIAIILIIVTIGYPYKAKLFPLLIAFSVAALLVAQIVKEASTKSEQETDAEDKKVGLKDTLAKYLTVPAWIIAFALSIYVLGYLVGIPLFFLIYLKLHGEKWLTTVICVLAVIVLVYGVFEVAFDIQLYKGILGE